MAHLLTGPSQILTYVSFDFQACELSPDMNTATPENIFPLSLLGGEL